MKQLSVDGRAIAAWHAASGGGEGSFASAPSGRRGFWESSFNWRQEACPALFPPPATVISAAPYRHFRRPLSSFPRRRESGKHKKVTERSQIIQ